MNFFLNVLNFEVIKCTSGHLTSQNLKFTLNDISVSLKDIDF